MKTQFINRKVNSKIIKMRVLNLKRVDKLKFPLLARGLCNGILYLVEQ